MEAAVTFYDAHGFPSDMPAIIDVSYLFDAAFTYATKDSRGNIFHAISYPLGQAAIKVVRPSYEQPWDFWTVISHLSTRFHLEHEGKVHEVVHIGLIPSKREMARLIDAEYARLHPAGVLTRLFNWLTKAA